MPLGRFHVAKAILHLDGLPQMSNLADSISLAAADPGVYIRESNCTRLEHC